MEYEGNKVEIIAPEKLAGQCEGVLILVLDMLKELSALEAETAEAYRRMEEENKAMGIPSYQAGPGFFEFWAKYRENVGKIVKPMCSEKLLKRGFGAHFSTPGKYDYIHGNCSIVFTMKSEKKAELETSFINCTLNCKHRFTLKNDGGRWLVDALSYLSEGSDKWNSDSI